MSKIWLPGGGGGGDGSDDCTILLPDVPKGLKAVTADSDDEAREGTLDTATTAADSHVLAGETYMKFNSGTKHWEKRTGGQANRGAWIGSVGMNSSVTVPAGNHNGAGKVNGPTVTQRGAWTGSVGMNGSTVVPEGYHTGGGKVNGPVVTQRGAWASGLGVNGTVNIPEGYHNGSGYVNQSIATKGAQTFTPGTSNQSIGAGHYLTGTQTILGDPNLTPANIAKGKTIFGKLGTYQGYADSPLYLFKSGVWSNLQTPGYTLFRGNDFTETRDLLFNGGVSLRLKQSINLSNYMYVVILAKGMDYQDFDFPIYLSVSTNPNIVSNSGYIASVNAYKPSASLLQLNVSSLSGEYYIYIHNISANQFATMTIKEIYLTTS